MKPVQCKKPVTFSWKDQEEGKRKILEVELGISNMSVDELKEIYREGKMKIFCFFYLY